MELLIWVAIWAAVFGFLGYYFAPKRGREPVLWAIICAITGLIGLIVLLVLPPKTAMG
jgi:hypothetical protein